MASIRRSEYGNSRRDSSFPDIHGRDRAVLLQTHKIFQLLQPDYYAAVVNDSKGCMGTANITLTQPPVLNGSAAGTNITCLGANNGTITISGLRCAGDLMNTPINGGGIWQAAPVFFITDPWVLTM